MRNREQDGGPQDVTMGTPKEQFRVCQCRTPVRFPGMRLGYSRVNRARVQNGKTGEIGSQEDLGRPRCWVF